MKKIFPLKEISPTEFERSKTQTVMCIHCNHDFYGADVLVTEDSKFFDNVDYDPKKYKVMSPDGINVYWLTCPSCKQINMNGFRPIHGGLCKDHMYT